MPRKTKKMATKKPASEPTTNKPQSKAAFVLAQDPRLSAGEVVKLAKTAGHTITAHRVHNIRWNAKRKGKVVRAPEQAKASRTARIGARLRRQPAGRKALAHAIAGMDRLDLAYAVSRLVAEGRTTATEVARLAAERTVRIEFLQAHLAALKTGGVPVVDVVKIAKARKPVRTVAKRAVDRRAEHKAATKAGKTITRSNGRKFTMTAKALAARKLQGQYLGHLRQVPDAEKPRFKAIAQEKGVAAAVLELRKRLGKK